MMYEFHGWIRLAESPSDIDEGGLDAKLALLQSAVSGLDCSNGRAEIMVANGVDTLLVNAVPNRRRDEATELAALIALVIEHFKGAYGIVYEYDEQTSTEYGRGYFPSGSLGAAVAISRSILFFRHWFQSQKTRIQLETPRLEEA